MEKITKKEIQKAIEILKNYKDAKRSLEDRIVEEEKWWRLQNWDVIRSEAGDGRCEPVSAWLFNSVANKHADAMDNYPEHSVLPRERKDEESARMLSKILPVIIENNNFENTYSDAWWYKLKHGAACYGVFWNQGASFGKGEVEITKIDLLNMFWEPGVSDIQQSENLFIVSLENRETFYKKYPHLKGIKMSNVIDIRQYAYDSSIDVSDKVLICDWYYKSVNNEGRDVLHFCKFTGDEILFATENEEQYKNTGLYDHAKYPVVIDAMYPVEGALCGFGLISVMKSPQMYIDRLNRVILENSIMSASVRYFAKDGSGVNEEEFLDWSRPIVHVEGALDEERLRRIDVSPVSGNVLSVLQMKIEEIKETSGNRDFSQGGASQGVTAASAIAALQEAGSKMSRDILRGSYRAFTKIGYFIIDLIKQFYDGERTFRIVGEGGSYEFLTFEKSENSSLFDIAIKPQRKSAYSKLSQNELAKELLRLGFFNPKYKEQSLIALELMDFDGKEVVREKIKSMAEAGE